MTQDQIAEIYSRLKNGESMKDIVHEIQKSVLDYALIKNYGNIRQASKTIGIDRNKCYRLLRGKQK